MNTLKVAILTMFNGLSNVYSLVNVVREQLEMLLADNISVKMLVSEHCPDAERTGIFADERIAWVKIVNSKNGQFFKWHTYTKAEDKIHDTFFEEASLIAADFVQNLQDVDVCILHDILYQGVHLVHNVAIREAQKSLPNVKFLAFTHSAPAAHLDADTPIRCMFSPMPNTTFLYPTQCGLAAIAKQYQVKIDRCACVSNSISPTLGLCAEARQILQTSGFAQRDILLVYPARLTLAKRFHIIAEFAGILKQCTHKSVGVIFCDFSSADIDPALYRFLVKDIAVKNGLASNDVVFTAECGYPEGISREAVFDLFSLSNLFLCPSYSESFGLTVIEAAARGNYIVLNEAVPALAEIGNAIDAYFMRWSARNFGFETIETYHPSERAYYIEHAQKIVANMEHNPVIKAKTLARTRYSSAWVYENQLKPLLYSQ
ncbi:MAG: glycosyltransferase [Ruthenibacterium sp.]